MVLWSQSIPKPVLHTVLVEVKGIWKSKPYISSNLTDPDPVTPDILLMVQQDTSLLQVMYTNTDLIGKRMTWHHSQTLANHLWARFIWHYPLNLTGQPEKDATNLLVWTGSDDNGCLTALRSLACRANDPGSSRVRWVCPICGSQSDSYPSLSSCLHCALTSKPHSSFWGSSVESGGHMSYYFTQVLFVWFVYFVWFKSITGQPISCN